MIDFKNAEIFKLKPVDNMTYADFIVPMLVEGEKVYCTFKSVRDGVVFTTKRIMVINVQGITGRKKDCTSLPYSKIQAFSIETAGMLDLDSELDLWFSGLGKVRLEFVTYADIEKINKIISKHVL